MDKRKIIIAIVSLGFISFLSFFLLKSKSKPQTPVAPVETAPTATPVTWKTYSNPDYEYLISYPPNWQVETWDIREAAKLTQVPDGSIWHQAKFEGEEGGFEVIIWENKTRALLKTWLSWFRHEDLDLTKVPEEENFQIGGMPAILYSQKDSTKGSLDHIFFQSEDRVYEFVEKKEEVLTNEVIVSNYDKMVSSFSYLEDEVKVEPKAENLISLAKEDLGQKLGVGREEISLLKIEAVDWPDTSLGCSKPGMFYAQVITPGYKITLEGRGETYTFHSDYKRVFLCEK